MSWPERPPADWLGFEEARSRVLDLFSPLATELVPLDRGLNRALAAPIVAAATLPPWDNSAMDGYAVRGSSVAGALEGAPIELRVVGEARAGVGWTGELGAGEAVRIMTGGPVPEAADSVVRVEDTDREVRPGTVAIRSDRDRDATCAPAGRTCARAICCWTRASHWAPARSRWPPPRGSPRSGSTAGHGWPC